VKGRAPWNHGCHSLEVIIAPSLTWQILTKSTQIQDDPEGLCRGAPYSTLVVLAAIIGACVSRMQALCRMRDNPNHRFSFSCAVRVLRGLILRRRRLCRRQEKSGLRLGRHLAAEIGETSFQGETREAKANNNLR